MVLLKGKERNLMLPKMIAFTFHYGSIKRIYDLYTGETLTAFTFHYGSIKSMINGERMLLELYIYIPLWFY